MLDLASLRAQASARTIVALPWWARELRSLREKAGLTQQQAAKKAGMLSPHWGVIERGETRPLIDTYEKMLTAVGAELEVMQP